MRGIVFCAAFCVSCLTGWLLVTEGMGNNVIFTTGIALCLWGYGWQYRRAIKMKWLHVTLCAAVVFFAGLVVWLAVYGQIDTTDYREDVAIVLGAGLRGEEVSATLQSRLDTAVAYHRRNPAAWLIVTGGQGPKEDISEALAMKRYLVACGVPAHQIVMEEQASSTYENMQFTKALLDERFKDSHRAVIITSDFHMYRSHRFAKQLGIQATRLHAGIRWYTIPANYIRESAAVVKMWLFKR